MSLHFRRALAQDFPALQQMLELYQYELSDIWPQEAAAQAFWRQTVSALMAGKFQEVEVKEGWWQGVVQQSHVERVA